MNQYELLLRTNNSTLKVEKISFETLITEKENSITSNKVLIFSNAINHNLHTSIEKIIKPPFDLYLVAESFMLFRALSEALHFEFHELWYKVLEITAQTRELFKNHKLKFIYNGIYPNSSSLNTFIKLLDNSFNCEALTTLLPNTKNQKQNFKEILLFVNTLSVSDLSSLASFLLKIKKGLFKTSLKIQIIAYGQADSSVLNSFESENINIIKLTEWSSKNQHNNEICLYFSNSLFRLSADISSALNLSIPVLSLNKIIQNNGFKEDFENSDIENDRKPLNLDLHLNSYDFTYDEDSSHLNEISKMLPILLKAYSLNKLGQYKESRALLIENISDLKLSRSAYIALSSSSLHQGAFEDAIIWAECAQFLEGKSPGTLILLGMSLAKKKQFSHARECFERAIKVAPFVLKPRKLLAALLLQMKEFSKAEEIYLTLLNELPNDKEILLGILSCYKSLKKEEEVKSTLLKIQEISS